MGVSWLWGWVVRQEQKGGNESVWSSKKKEPSSTFIIVRRVPPAGEPSYEYTHDGELFGCSAGAMDMSNQKVSMFGCTAVCHILWCIYIYNWLIPLVALHYRELVLSMTKLPKTTKKKKTKIIIAKKKDRNSHRQKEGSSSAIFNIIVAAVLLPLLFTAPLSSWL